MKYRTWKCGICGEPVIEGQRFLFIRKTGFVHLECVLERLGSRGSLDRDTIAAIDANEIVTYSIVRLKEAEALSSDEKLREKIVSLRKVLERYSADLSSHLENMI